MHLVQLSGGAMNRTFATSALAAAMALATTLVAPAAQAETLLIDRVEAEKSLPLPTRGLSMSDIEARYGAPEERLDPRGGQQPQWPVINRWVYPSFIVYFEKNKVIDVVARQATPLETGPKPVE
jgi:hypothetical protein